MAFRHYTGTVQTKASVWRCPTCNAEVTTPLEQGCPQCNAGRDAAQARAAKAMEQALPSTQSRTPLEQWVYARYPEGLDTAGWVIAQGAWDAAIRWENRQRKEHTEVAKVPAGGSWELAMISAGEHDKLDPRAHQTIVAALAFYRDNQLAYGAVPGLLSAQECSELIEKLQPQEEGAGK
jgi:hypothetical protein